MVSCSEAEEAPATCKPKGLYTTPRAGNSNCRQQGILIVANQTFPLQVTSWEKSGSFASKKLTVAIIGLADAQEGTLDEEYGLTCWGRNPNGEEIEFPLDEIELGKKDPNRRLLSDYAYWFHNWR